MLGQAENKLDSIFGNYTLSILSLEHCTGTFNLINSMKQCH